MNSRLVYICSPYAGNIEKNVEFAKNVCRYAIKQNCTPVAVHLLYPQLLDDSDPVQRKIGISMGLRVLQVCDELWCCGSRISEGMGEELAAARQLGIPIKEISESEIQGGINMKQYGVWAVRSVNSMFGAAQSWCKHDGEPIRFDTCEQAAEHSKSLNEDTCRPNVHCFPKEMEPELRQSSGMSIKL